MATSTSYLYGDSTLSPLKTDFIAFLRDAFDFSVQALLCDARLTEATQRAISLAEFTESEIGDAEAFAVEVAHALDGIGTGRAESIAARCAARVRQGVTDILRAEVDTARAAVVSAKGSSVHAAMGERETCARAFEALVLRHTLPEATHSLRMSLESTGTYAAQASASTPYGFSWVLALEIPPSHALARVLRIDRLVDRLEIGAPEEAGWLHKEVKVRPQRFDRLHLAQLTLDPSESRMKLRAAPDGSGIGFDVSFHHETGAIELRRVLEGGPSSETPYRVEGDDVAKLQSLRDNLIAMTADLHEHKKALIEAKLDDDSLKEIEIPRALVDRLIGNIAATVQEIAKRTLSPGELVLKRLVSDNQREEVFLSKAELEGKMDALPPALRHAFDPLELWSEAAPKREPAARSRETSSMAPRAPKVTPLPRPAPTPRPEREVTAREERAPVYALDESEPALADAADSAPGDRATDVAAPDEKILRSPAAVAPHPFTAGALAPVPAMRPSRPPRP